MSGGHIVLECQKCLTQYEINSEEEIGLCKKCGSCVLTVNYGFIPVEPENTFSTEHRRNSLLMAKAKIVKMPPDVTGKKSKTAKSSKSTKKVSSSVGKKFKGTESGLGVLAYQNKTLTDNRRAHLDDESIAKMWRDEFPSAKPYTAKDVNSVRNAFNRGKHGNELPARPIPVFDEDGNQIKKKVAPPVKKNSVKKKVTDKKSSKKAQDDDDDDDDEEDGFDDDEE